MQLFRYNEENDRQRLEAIKEVRQKTNKQNVFVSCSAPAFSFLP